MNSRDLMLLASAYHADSEILVTRGFVTAARRLEARGLLIADLSWRARITAKGSALCRELIYRIEDAD